MKYSPLNPHLRTIALAVSIVTVTILQSCNENQEKKQEQLTIDEFQTPSDSSGNSLKRNATFKQLVTSSNSVLLTGLDKFRLVPIYKIRAKADRNISYDEGTSYYDEYEMSDGGNEYKDEDAFKYFMPGMDIIHGYNLINVGHYDIENKKLSYFFDKPVLIKTLYFPGVKSDSLHKTPVSRNYFMVSAYDEDTNKDSLINKRDLRKFYHFDQSNTKRTPLLPVRYSAIRSTYDFRNDIMYIYSRYDANRNGTPDKNEPVMIFWINLKDPIIATRLL